MVCPRCNNNLPDNSIACNKCGFMFQQIQYVTQPQPQKKSVKKLVITLVSIIVGVIILSILIPIIISYIPREIDYGDAESFEQDLNNGVNTVGKVVQFKVDEFKQPIAGYNLWAGEHLNFVSTLNPGCSKGDIVVVKIKRVINNDGKWHIRYKMLKNAYETNNTKHK